MHNNMKKFELGIFIELERSEQGKELPLFQAVWYLYAKEHGINDYSANVEYTRQAEVIYKKLENKNYINALEAIFWAIPIDDQPQMAGESFACIVKAVTN